MRRISPICNAMLAFHSAKAALSRSGLIFLGFKIAAGCAVKKKRRRPHRRRCKYDAVMRNQDANIYHEYCDANIQVCVHVDTCPEYDQNWDILITWILKSMQMQSVLAQNHQRSHLVYKLLPDYLTAPSPVVQIQSWPRNQTFSDSY